jgi:HK97 family phage portal protein
MKLEEGRASRQAQAPISYPGLLRSGRVEIAPGRGDLNRMTTWPWNGLTPPTSIDMIGDYRISFTRLFETQPWISAAVRRMLMWAIRVPLKAYRRGGSEHDRIRLHPGDHPIADLIARPWRGASTSDLVQELLGPLLIHGNSVTEVIQGRRLEFEKKDWRFAIPVQAWRGSLEGFTFDTDDVQFTRDVSIDRILYLKHWSPSGPIGISPLTQLGVTLRIENAAQRYQQSVFQSGGRPPSVVTSNDDYFATTKQQDRQTILNNLRGDIDRIFGSPEGMARPALLPPGLDWKSIGGSAVEAELINQRKVARDEIAAVYLIPPPMLGILDKATYSNISTQREMTYTDCMGPPLILIEQGINAQVIRDLLQEDDVFVEFDFGPVLRGNRTEEINALRAAIGTGLYSPNEGRVVLNMNRVELPGMDDLWMPVNNLQPVDTAQRSSQAKERQLELQVHVLEQQVVAQQLQLEQLEAGEQPEQPEQQPEEEEEPEEEPAETR